MENKQEKVLLITDEDLDGAGSAILCKVKYQSDVDVLYSINHNPDNHIKDLLENKSYENYDKIFITDVSPSEELAQKIEDCQILKYKIKLYDHHTTALWLNKYKWAYVNEFLYDMPVCGTYLLYHFGLSHKKMNEKVLAKGFKQSYYNLLDNFITIVRKYDTWEWAKENDLLPKKMNDYFMFVGMNKFVEQMTYNILMDKGVFNSEMNLITGAIHKQYKEYLNQQQEKLITTEFDKYNIGVVFSERYDYISMLGNDLAKQNLSLDFIMIININENRASLRGIKEDIHLGEIAKKYFNGGGRKNTAGFDLDDSIKYQIFNKYCSPKVFREDE